MSAVRRFAAPASIALCAILLLASYHFYYGQAYKPPILLNTKFKLFTLDPETNSSRPLLWIVVYNKGPGDLAFIREDVVGGEKCLGLHVYQDGANDTYDWVSVHVKQKLVGKSVERLFKARIGLWVYPTFSYVYYGETGDPRNAFGVEINDGTHLLWFIFSDKNAGVYQLRNHRIVVIEAPLNQWSYVEIDVGEEYRKAGWEVPRDAFFILLVGATKHDPGWRAGFFKEILIREELD